MVNYHYCMSNVIGEQRIALSFDTKSLRQSQTEVERETTSWAGRLATKNGGVFGNAWSVAVGNIVTKGISTVASSVTNSMSAAIARVDTINNFPKVMQSLGYSADDSDKSIKTLSERIDGLPTSLNSIVGNVQMLTSSMGNLNSGTVNATNLGIALNDMFLAGGQGAEAASRAFTQYNQMLARGKVDQQGWNSLIEVAPGQMAQLAKQLLGATANQNDLYEALQDGTISFEQMNEAMIHLDNEGGEGFSSWAQQAKDNTGGIGTAFENVQNRIAKAIQKIIDHIGADKIAGAINGISAGFSGIADIVIGIIDFLATNEWVVQFIGTATGVVLGLGAAVWVVNAAMSVNPITWIILAIGALVAGIVVLITHIQDVGNFFISVFSAIGSFITGWIDFQIQQVMNFVGAVMNVIGAIAGWVNQNVIQPIGRFFNGLWEGIKAGVEGVKSVVQAIFNAIVAIIKAPINGIITAINGVLSMINSIKVPDWVPIIGGAHTNFGMIPTLAQGGYATAATPAVFGEAGKEVALPLERNTDNWAGLLANTLIDELDDDQLGTGSGVTIERMNFNIDNELNARDIGRVMMQSIRRAA